jgi:hypothetical protein
MFSAIMGWVEKGAAPNRLTSHYFAPDTVKAGGPADMSKVIRTRPVFPYPRVARYKGSGSIDDEANFEAGNRVTPEPPSTGWDRPLTSSLASSYGADGRT